MNNKGVKYSIIVPVYNIETYIRRCIDSILSQQVKDFELLLIDDGSRDMSGIICDEYALKDSRIKVFHKANGGASYARNVGLDNCNGEYIIFIDSDDWIEHNYIFELSSGQNADLSVCSFNIGNSEPIDSLIVKEGLNDLTDIRNLLGSKIILEPQFSAPWCKMFKRSIIEKYNIRYQENITVGEDTIFVLQYISHIGNFFYVNKKLYNVWQSGVGLSSYGNSPKNFFNFERKLSEISIYLAKIFNIEIIPFKSTILSNILGNYIHSYKELSVRSERIAMIKELRRIKDIDHIFSHLYSIGKIDKVLVWLFKHKMYYLYDYLNIIR